MDDLISRQAVLDYINSMSSELTADGRRMIRRIRLTEYIQDSIPSAQPEIIRCKDCKHYLRPHGCGYIDGMVTAQEDGFCSYAERRTDGADAVAKKLMGVGE